MPEPVDFAVFRAEWRDLLRRITDGSLLNHPLHRGLPADLRQLKDLSFSGDGEPTTSVHFPAVIDEVTSSLASHGLGDLPLILLSNCSMVHRPAVAEALTRFAAAGGEIHGKLDGGGPGAYARVDKTAVPFERTLANLLEAGQRAPLVIQSLFCQADGIIADAIEIDHYADHLSYLLDGGADLRSVHLHTVARKPPFAAVKGLPRSFLEAVAHRVQGREPRLSGRIQCFAGEPRFETGDPLPDLT
ncbi:MAG: hypothetical protein CMH55_01760 [Myxococcales bacterium]|nr:hypothetical protein [Myxococcales bacterium]